MEQILTCHLCQTTIFSGINSTDQLASELQKRGIQHPVFVTDGKISSCEWFGKLIAPISSKVVYDRVTPNPKDYEVMQGVEFYKDHSCDMVIGIGGGSAMDCAKAISAMVRHEGCIMDYGRSNPNRKYFTAGREPLILIPTTMGTGSEVSPHAVITNTKKDKKSDLQELIFYPDAVFLNPVFLMTLPKDIVKDTGIDALCHAIEVYTSKKVIYQFAPLHEAAALKAIELVAEYLRPAVFAGDTDLNAKAHMQWAAMLAGFALDLDAGCAHGLTGVLQKRYHCMTHGQSVGLILPSVMEYNALSYPKRFRAIAEAFHEPLEDCNDQQAAQKAISAVRRLLKDIQFVKLSDFMSNQNEIEEFYQEGAGNSCNQNNARTVTAEDARSIYLRAFHDSYEEQISCN